MLRIVLVLVLVGCGAAATSGAVATPTAGPTRVELEGALAHPAARADLDPSLLAVLEAYEAIVGEEIEPPRDGSMEEHQRWQREVFTPYVAAQRERVVALEQQAFALVEEADPAGRMLVALCVGHAWERFYTTVTAIPAPQTVAGNPALVEMYRSHLADAAVPLAHRSAAAYAHCAGHGASAGPDVATWRERCAERATRLRALEVSAPPPPASQPEGEPIGVVGGTASGGLMVRTCESDSECVEGRTCQPLGGVVDGAGRPVRTCAAQ